MNTLKEYIQENLVIINKEEVELCLPISDLDLLTIGFVNDMFTEKNNDEYKYKEVATQEDFDKF